MITEGRNQWHCQLQRIPVAIIGMASLFPKSRNLQEYWENIINKTDCITDVPPSCWNVEDYYDTDPKAADKVYSRRGGFLPEVDFDPLEFGLPPDTLEAIDSAQLLSLIVAKAALEDAGYGKSREFNRQTTGVVLGASGLWKMITPLTSRLQYPIWRKVLKSSGLSDDDSEKIIGKIKSAYVPWQENSFPGMLTNVVAGRITNRLDLGGTNCTVDAACASSLSAFKMAVGELIERRCDLMITGGVDTDNSALNYMCFSKTPALSKKDYLSPFDADSDGMMVGEGIGMLVLKRLNDAERDGDRIYAVVKGIGTSSDGRYKSIYAPRPEGQALALRRAYEDAGFSPSTVGLMEAHGTGTPRGDLCEFTALKEVFSENNPKQQHIALGSVKSQIGHTKAGAGAASLIKVALSLHHKILPPTINVTTPNPKFEIEKSPFYINTEVKPWIQGNNTLRRAGVSSFGFGGTNYHVVLEEYDQVHSCSYRLHAVPRSVFLWEKTPERLLARCEAALTDLTGSDAGHHYQELLLTYKTVEVPLDAARVGFVVESLEEARDLLQTTVKLLQKQTQANSWEHPRGIYYRKQGMPLQGKVVALFPGQGSQYLNMGRKLAVDFPPLHEVYKAMDELFVRDGLTPLSQIVFPVPPFGSCQQATEVEALQSTEHAQPAIGAFSVGLYKILQQGGFKPDFTAGHSFGELTALWAAQVLSDEDYFFLIKARGQAMGIPHEAHPCDAGTMLAVKGDVTEIEKIVQGFTHLSVANFNAPDQVVLSGSKPLITTVRQICSNRGYTVTPLPVSAAFHTAFVSHASEPFAKAIESVTFNSPSVPVYSNTSGEAYPSDPQAIRQILKEHLLKSVHFDQEIENIYAQGGYCFIEIGPRRILTSLVQSILGDRPHLALALNASREKDSDLQLRQTILQLQVAGLPLKNIDPYQLDPIPASTPANKRLTISLNGSNYVSEKTRKTFEAALQDGHQVQIPNVGFASTTPTPISQGRDDVEEGEFAIPLTASVYLKPETNESESLSQALPESESSSQLAVATLAKVQAHSLKPSPEAVPVLFVENFTSESETMLDPISPASTPPSVSAIEKLLTQFCNHQSEILRVHEQYLKSQAECSQAFFHIVQQIQQGGGDRITSAIPLPSEADQRSLSASRITSPEPQRLPPTIPQTTNGNGYTSPLALTPLEPEVALPVPNGNGRSNGNGNGIRSIQEPVQEPISKVTPLPTLQLPVPEPVTQPTAALDDSLVVPPLLSVVSDKTGYPTEMLELEMDLEADLGIDSIKRVEIMGMVQEVIPEMPRLSTEALAELRTLRQIADYLMQQLAGAEKKIA